MAFAYQAFLWVAPKKNVTTDKKTKYIDNADRVEVERTFSLAKRCYGFGQIKSKLNSTTRNSILLSIFTMNGSASGSFVAAVSDNVVLKVQTA